MSRSIIETVLGALVLLGALIFLVFSYSEGDVAEVSGYTISADFSNIGGLQAGDPVQISGVKIGQVAKIDLNPESYLAQVTMEVDNTIKITDDATALISSQSLLGGKYMDLQPGSSETYLEKGGKIEYTQSPQNLEELLGKFIFSASNKGKDESAPQATASTDTPITHSAEPTVEKSESEPTETESEELEPNEDSPQPTDAPKVP